MNSERAQAYGRAMRGLSEAGLSAQQQETVREAADSLVFSTDLMADEEARAALDALHHLADELVEHEALDPDSVERLVADVEGCGPVPAEVF